jgi:hypothetical protein
METAQKIWYEADKQFNAKQHFVKRFWHGSHKQKP